MSDEEIQLIQDQISAFKLPVGTNQLVKVLQSRLVAIKAKRQPVEPSPAPPDKPGVDLQEIATQIKLYFEELSEQMGDRLIQLSGPEGQLPSLLYEHIEDDRVRNQLIADNMRMEGALRKVEFLPDFHEEQAFRRFCTFAAFQVEEMLNYFYFNRYGDDITTLIREFKHLDVEVRTFGDDIRKTKSIDKIITFVKVKAYNKEFYGKDLSFYNTLMNIRNMEEHRCSVLLKSKQELPSIENYAIQTIRERNHVSVRDYLGIMYKNITR